MNLLIHRDGQQLGPYTLEQARNLLTRGELTPADLAWSDGATEWVPLAQVLKGGAIPGRKRSVGKIVLLGLAGLFVVLIAGWTIWRVQLSSTVTKRLAAAKAAGYPTNPAELDAWYAAVPDQENAALLFLQATNQLLHSKSSQATEQFRLLKAQPRTAPLSAQLSQSFAADVQANSAALTLLHQLTKLKNSRYPVDFAKGGIMSLEHLSPVKEAANLVRKEALLAADGQRPGVTTSDSILTCLALGRTLKPEPTLVSQLVRVAVDHIAFETLERALNRTTFTDAELVSLVAALEEEDDSTAFSRALAGERAAFVPYFRMSRSDAARLADPSSPSDVPLSGGPGAMRWTGFFERDLAFYLSAMETNIAMLSLPAPQSLAVTNINDQLDLQARRKICILSAMLLPAYGKIACKSADQSARLRVARTALAMERYRLAHQNQLPDSLTKLTPAYLPTVPVDPWDGQSLRLKRSAKGYVVYSVGPDGQDDNGLEQATDQSGKKIPGPFDITLTVEK
jgi:hypothetical protein